MGKSLDEILARAAKNGAIAIRPEALLRPVICQIHNSSAQLLLDQAATTPQINISLRHAADACGVMASLTTHDSKRGFTRDYTYAPPLLGVARPDVAFAASHTMKTIASGTTQLYAGQSNTAGYKHQVENQYQDRREEKFGIKTAGTYKDARLTSEEIDLEIKAGEDKTDKYVRQRAATRIHKRRREQFYNGNLESVE